MKRPEDYYMRIFSAFHEGSCQNKLIQEKIMEINKIPMIFYAQDPENVIFWRPLKNVKNIFYLNVKAADPMRDSVARWFYDKG